jgi:hypothetical protein
MLKVVGYTRRQYLHFIPSHDSRLLNGDTNSPNILKLHRTQQANIVWPLLYSVYSPAPPGEPGFPDRPVAPGCPVLPCTPG